MSPDDPEPPDDDQNRRRRPGDQNPEPIQPPRPETAGDYDDGPDAAEFLPPEIPEEELPAHELVGEQVRSQLIYYPTVTREPFRNQGRVTDLLASGKLPADVGLPPLDASTDRVMICGSPAMLRDVSSLLDSRGFDEGNSGEPGAYLYERAFAEK